jgi:hypothetical protein
LVKSCILYINGAKSGVSLPRSSAESQSPASCCPASKAWRPASPGRSAASQLCSCAAPLPPPLSTSDPRELQRSSSRPTLGVVPPRELEQWMRRLYTPPKQAQKYPSFPRLRFRPQPVLPKAALLHRKMWLCVFLNCVFAPRTTQKPAQADSRAPAPQSACNKTVKFLSFPMFVPSLSW